MSDEIAYVMGRDGLLYGNPVLANRYGFLCFPFGHGPKLVAWVDDEGNSATHDSLLASLLGERSGAYVSSDEGEVWVPSPLGPIDSPLRRGLSVSISLSRRIPIPNESDAVERYPSRIPGGSILAPPLWDSDPDELEVG